MDTKPSLRLAFVALGVAVVLGACGDGGGCLDYGDEAPTPSITLTSPAGGETWAIGTEHEITWESVGVESVRIELSRDRGWSWEELAASADARTGSFIWTVVGNCSPVCLVRVSSAADDPISDTSDLFTIWSGIVWYVDDDAAWGGDGRSWAAAFQHPQYAVDAASAGDEVWVAGGVYKRRGAVGARLLTMKDGVAIYGGIAAGATTREGRDLMVNEAILDGDADGDLVGDVYHVVMGAPKARLDGFTVTRGNANGTSSDGEGGGLRARWASDLVIANCKFSGNEAIRGGGVHNGYARCEFIHCSFSANSAVESGGGLYQHGSYDVEIISCTFSANAAGVSGGGVFNDSGITLLNCSFAGNSAGVGGAVCNSLGPSPTVTNTILWGNSAMTAGPEIHNESGASYPMVTYSCIQGGYAGAGNMDLDPLFVDAGSGDLKLQAGSPCIDAGDGDAAPEVDVNGNVRHEDPGVVNSGRGDMTFTDIGAHEFQGASTARWLEVTGPQAGVLCRVGSDLNVVWRASTDFTHVFIELSRDGGQSWETLAEKRPNDGLYTWPVTDGGLGLPQRDCVIRVSDASDPALSDTSNGLMIFSGVLYVDVNAPAGGDGMSWDSAFRHPQEAMAVAPPGTEVRVAGGTYVAQNPEDTTVLVMKHGVSLLGGYAGYGAADPNGRDLSAHETILSGDLAGDDDPVHPFGDPLRNDGENSDHVVVGSSNATLDGFTVTGGKADGVGRDASSAGMSCDSVTALVVANCTFSANQADIFGGAVYARRSSCRFENCEFRANRGEHGGAISMYACFGEIVRCRFVANVSVDYAGALDVWDTRGESVVTIASTLFEGNRCTEGKGGAIHTEDASPSIVNCSFHGNFAGRRGGGIHTSVYWTTPDKIAVRIQNCVLWDNSSQEGPQIQLDYEGPQVSYSCIEGGWEGEGNIDADPLFVDPGHWDDNGTPGDTSDDFWVDADYHLSPGSPCIDTADPATELTEDIDGNPRPAGSGYDMGAYEYQP